MPDLTAGIVDSESVRAAVNIPRSTSGWDGGKKVAGCGKCRRIGEKERQSETPYAVTGLRAEQATA